MNIDGYGWTAAVGVVSLLSAVAVVIVVPPADGYELSLYGAYPPFFWVLVIGAIFAGSVAIIYGDGTARDGTRLVGVLTVLVTNAMLLLMPYIRGYRMQGRSDTLSHIGFIRDIAGSGGIGGNMYPPIHVLVLALSDATGTEPMTVGMAVPAVFSILYFGGMFYLLLYLFDSRQQVYIGLPFVLLPVLRDAHVGLRPFDQSLMLIPFVLYAFFKRQRYPMQSISAVLVLALVALLFYHPLTALFMIGVFAICFGVKYAPRIRTEYMTPTNILSLSAAVFLVWYSSFTGIILRFNRIYNTLFGLSGEEGAPLSAYTETVAESSPALLDLIRVLALTYGVDLVLFGLGFGFIVIVAWHGTGEGRYIDSHAAIFVGTLGLFSVGGLLFLTIDFIVLPERPFQIAKVAAVVLAGQAFYLLWHNIDRLRETSRGRVSFHAALMVALLLLAVLSTFSMYESPSSSERNHQVTEMELEGSQWLMEHRDESVGELLQFGIKWHRFHDAQYGTLTRAPYWGTFPPPHFNYTNRETLGESYATDRYLVITRYGRNLYPATFPNYRDQWKFTPQDFQQLERDRTTARIYDSGDFTLYVVHGTEGEN